MDYQQEIRFEKGSLMARSQQQAIHALKSGALCPIPTRIETFPCKGVDWVCRILAGTDHKPANFRGSKPKSESPSNPFLPYDPDMEVAIINDRHAILLNKFKVVDGHLLMVTRDYEHQSEALTEADFFSIWAILREMEGLAFYNGGAAAGASQHHKHLQFIPYPLHPTQNLPIDTLLGNADSHVSAFSFAHTFSRFEADLYHHPVQAAKRSLACYRRMLRCLALGDGVLPPGPYNLLATREWMLIVPRNSEFQGALGCNSLGYAGSMFVRNDAQLDLLKRFGPMNLLRNLGFPR